MYLVPGSQKHHPSVFFSVSNAFEYPVEHLDLDSKDFFKQLGSLKFKKEDQKKSNRSRSSSEDS